MTAFWLRTYRYPRRNLYAVNDHAVIYPRQGFDFRRGEAGFARGIERQVPGRVKINRQRVFNDTVRHLVQFVVPVHDDFPQQLDAIRVEPALELRYLVIPGIQHAPDKIKHRGADQDTVVIGREAQRRLDALAAGGGAAVVV